MFRKLGFVAAAALALTGVIADAKPKLTGEEQLTKLLDGRVAGKPVMCINTRNAGNATVIDKTAIVYGTGNTVYVQRPRVGVESLSSNDILVTVLPISQLCSVDTIQLRDRLNFFWRGFVGLGEFVPYTRPAKEPAAG